MKAPELNKIAYNCRKATFLIEKQQIISITMREKIELNLHLAGCSICKTFMQQSVVITKIVHNLFHSPARNDLKLDDRFKEELQENLNERLSKK